MNKRFLHVVPEPLDRPDLRRPRRSGCFVYRIRVDLDDATPPIWRRIDVRSDLTLDVVHHVLQAAFDWTDSHLHRFSLGGGAFDRHSQHFLCPYDVDNPEWDDDGGVAAAEVRLDETLQEPGDVLHYLYDYGDTWQHTLRLEEVLPASSDTVTATVVDGDRAAPPEDCGGLTDARDLAEVLEDPSRFDLESANRAMREPFFVLREHGVDARLVELVHRLHYTTVGEELDERALAMVREPSTVSSSETVASLAAYQWFLDRAVEDGIPLTSAGYLKPADVVAVSKVLPATGNWFGAHNRETHTAPVLDFRLALQAVGLLRKHKGRLLLTRAGSAAQRDPAVLWKHLATRLVPTSDDFDLQATLLLLLHIGTAAVAGTSLRTCATALSELGWRQGDGQPVEHYALYRMTARTLLINTTDRGFNLFGLEQYSTAAGALARAALHAGR